MEKWKVVGADEGSPFIHMAAYCVASNSMKPILGLDSSTIGQFTGKNAKWCIDLDVCKPSVFLVIKKLLERDFFNSTIEKSLESISTLQQYAETLNKMQVNVLTNSQLYSHYKKLFDLWVELNIWGHVVNLPDFETLTLSNKINSFLKKRITAANLGLTLAEVFSALVTPNKRSELQQQDLDFYNLLVEYKSGKNIEKDLQKHSDKYKWLQFHYDGPTILEKPYFEAGVISATKQGLDAEKETSKILQCERQVQEMQVELTKKLLLSEEETHWLEVARQFGYLKSLRKDAVFRAGANSYPLIKEIAKRLNLTTVQLKFLTLDEVKVALESEKVNLAELNSRMKHCIVTFDNEKLVIYSGETANQLASMIYEEKAEDGLVEIKGMSAFPGIVSGVVKILRNAEDMKKFGQGDILVSMATNPNLISAMKIAGAIVTDEGGITCHAAIVSRELRIPCVIGTKVATKWLKDGDKVEVDAVKGVVRKL